MLVQFEHLEVLGMVMLLLLFCYFEMLDVIFLFSAIFFVIFGEFTDQNLGKLLD